MARSVRRWTTEEISFDIVYDLTGHPVVTTLVLTPVGPPRFMAEPVMQGATTLLKGLHVQALSRNAVGMANLTLIARVVMERMDLDGLVVDGAVRSTGANPGHRPRGIRFTRRIRAAHDA
jgi:hypothetical protein